MPSIHLLVLVHGMWGNPDNVAEMHRVITDQYSEPSEDGTELRVLVAEANKNDGTYDGVDWCGERVTSEITTKVAELTAEGHTVRKFSIIGYSLGGLISRYIIGILHQRGFFDSVTPINFNTIATPHIGLPRFPSFFSTVASTLGPHLLSRTGEQFYCVDKWSKTGKPLLQVMADPEKIFYKALIKFKNIKIYANATNDRTVPFVTAYISAEDPFWEHEESGIQIEFDSKHPRIIQSYTRPPKGSLVKKSRKELKAEKKTKKPLLPPFLQFRFPFNLILYGSLPLLVPVAISLAITRFALAARGSRARIQKMEKDALLALSESDEEGSAKGPLHHLIEKWEKEVESTIEDVLEEARNPDQLPTSPSDDSIPSSTTSSTLTTAGSDVESPALLTPLQHTLIANLNTIPHLQKVVAWFPEGHNSHAVIISRDVKRFPFHKEGEIVLRHWAIGWEL